MLANTYSVSNDKVIIPLNDLIQILDNGAFSFQLKGKKLELHEIDRELQIIAAYKEAKNAPESDFVELSR